MVLLCSWTVDVDIRLMITEMYSEPSRTFTIFCENSQRLKAVNYISQKLLSNDTIIMTFYLYQNVRNNAKMTLYLASKKLCFKKTLGDSETELHFSCNNG